MFLLIVIYLLIIFLDTRDRDSVKDFLIKIESGIYTGYINDVIVSEVYHNFIRVKR